MMLGMHYNNNNNNGYNQKGKKKDGNFAANNEPISVLDTWSPSPSTSTSTFSSLNNNTHHQQQGNLVVNELPGTTLNGMGSWVLGEAKVPLFVDNVGHGLSEKSNLGGFVVEGLDNLSESEEGKVLQQQNEIFNMLFQGNNSNNNNITQFEVNKNPNFSQFQPSGYNDGSGFSNLLYGGGEFEGFDHKDEIFNPCFNQIMANSNPLLFGSSSSHHLNVGFVNSSLGSFNTNKVPVMDPGHDLLVKQQNLQQIQPEGLLFQPPSFIPPHMPLLVPKQEPVGVSVNERQIVYDELLKAAESIQAGNLCNAQAILARLNHFLPPIGIGKTKPFQRSAFYLKQALESTFNQVSQLKIPSPFDGMFRMGAYKVYSEVSPVIRFSNFTANQILLEALDGAQQIHIVDFDIGFGAHWSSFLQELPRNGVATSVKITAFASPSTHHPVEIKLMHENLSQFANELGITFALEVVNIDSFDPNLNSVASFRSSQTEAIVVNFPVWSFANYLSALPAYLCFIKKLSPKILVSLDCGCERIDLPFPRHMLHVLNYYEALFDSVDAANLTSEAANKIEKFLFQPRIESTVMGRLIYPHVIPPWRNLLTSAGFTPATISTFAEAQAECVLKRTQVRGFHVDKRNGSLVLSWQRGELLSVSAWH